MSFNTTPFFVFFSLVFLIYFSVKKSRQWLVLLSASIFFYAFYYPVYLGIPLSIAILTFIGAKLIKTSRTRKKFWLFLTTLSCLLVLFVFKYFNFFITNFDEFISLFGYKSSSLLLNLVMPLGISFYIFQSLSYVFEIYRGNMKLEKSFGRYLLFVMFFPLILSGPIERANRLIPQLSRKHSLKYAEVTMGLKLVAWGLFKKVVIADRLGSLVNQVYKNPQSYWGAPLLLASVFFVYQLYCDFSGYSDMARGIAQILGIKVTNNFNSPFNARSVSDFWRKWHISLSSYLSDYLYTPLAIYLRNKGKFGIITVVFITFILIGFWHGANWTYGIFGIIQAVAISFEIITKKVRRRLFKNIPTSIYSPLALLLTFGIWNISCIFFRSNNVSDAIYILTHLASYMPFDLMLHRGLGPGYDITVGLIGIVVLESVQWLQRRQVLASLDARLPIWSHWLAYFVLVASIMSFGAFGNNKFIYFNF